jgi:syntaxin-binding protein 1
MATGETSEGKTIKNAMLDLIPVLSNTKASVTDKLRTLIIYIIAMNGIQDNERTKLLTAGSVSSSSSQGINNLQSFGVNLSASSSSKEKGRYTYWGSYKKEKKKRKAKGNDLPYDTSRYVPLMKRLLEDQAANAIPIETFPWVLTPPDADLGITDLGTKMFRMVSNGIVPPDPNHPNSLRTIRATWAGQTRAKTNNKAADNYVEKFDLRRNGNRIILFSLGGLTYSEIRSAYEASKENQREVFIGI